MGSCEAMSTCDHLAMLKGLLADPKLRIESSCLQRIQPIGRIRQCTMYTLDRSRSRIDPSLNIRYVSSSGRGSFADVELCWLSSSSSNERTQVAVKRFHKAVLRDDSCLQLLCNELTILTTAAKHR